MSAALIEAAKAALNYIEEPPAKLWPAGTLHRITINLRTALAAAEAQPVPIDMVLHCPACGKQHIDAPEECPDEGCPHYGTPHSHPDSWDNPPHRSHLCGMCGYVWRPADVPTNGVAAVKTKGKADSPAVSKAEAQPVALTPEQRARLISSGPNAGRVRPAQPVGEPVATVSRSALDWMRSNKPALCDKAGLREVAAPPAQPACEPAGWHALLDVNQRPHQLQTRLHCVGFQNKRTAEAWVASERGFNGWNYTLVPVHYAAPPAQPAAQAPLTSAARAELLASLEEPDDELLAEFQRAFVQQLRRRKHKTGLESAELAGIRAMLKMAISRERAHGIGDPL